MKASNPGPGLTGYWTTTGVFHAGHVAFDGAPAEVFAHTQALLDIGLDVPKAARIAQALRDRGVALPPSIYTLEQLTDALLAVGKEAGVC